MIRLELRRRRSRRQIALYRDPRKGTHGARRQSDPEASPWTLRDFHHFIAQRAVAKPVTTDADRLHLPKVKPDGMLSSFDVSCQLREAAIKKSGVSTRIQPLAPGNFISDRKGHVRAARPLVRPWRRNGKSIDRPRCRAQRRDCGREHHQGACADEHRLQMQFGDRAGEHK